MKDKLRSLCKPILNNKDSALLSKLFRSIIKDRGMLFQMETKVDEYILNAHKDDIRVVKGMTKTQINNKMLDEEMTWKNFIDLIFNVLRFRKLRLVVELTDQKGNTTMHEIVSVKELNQVEKICDEKIKNLDHILKKYTSEIEMNAKEDHVE